MSCALGKYPEQLTFLVVGEDVGGRDDSCSSSVKTSASYVIVLPLQPVVGPNVATGMAPPMRSARHPVRSLGPYHELRTSPRSRGQLTGRRRGPPPARAAGLLQWPVGCPGMMPRHAQGTDQPVGRRGTVQRRSRAGKRDGQGQAVDVSRTRKGRGVPLQLPGPHHVEAAPSQRR